MTPTSTTSTRPTPPGSTPRRKPSLRTVLSARSSSVGSRQGGQHEGGALPRGEGTGLEHRVLGVADGDVVDAAHAGAGALGDALHHHDAVGFRAHGEVGSELLGGFLVGDAVDEEDVVVTGRDGHGEGEAAVDLEHVAAGQGRLDVEVRRAVGQREADHAHGAVRQHVGAEGAVAGVAQLHGLQHGELPLAAVGAGDGEGVVDEGEDGEVVGELVHGEIEGAGQGLAEDAVGVLDVEVVGAHLEAGEALRGQVGEGEGAVEGRDGVVFHELAGRDLVAEGDAQADGGVCAFGAVAHRAAERRGGLRRGVGGEGGGGHKHDEQHSDGQCEGSHGASSSMRCRRARASRTSRSSASSGEAASPSSRSCSRTSRAARRRYSRICRSNSSPST